MPWLLGTLLVWMLARTEIAMQAAAEACRLFVTSVMPGLLPYMVISRLLLGRIGRPLPPGGVMLLGWGGGSPTGALLLAHAGDIPLPAARRIAVSCATMSPMFLVGTLGQWLQSPAASLCVFVSVILGGYLAGCLSGSAPHIRIGVPRTTITFGRAVEETMRTMLLVCGTMAVMRMIAALVADILPRHNAVVLPVITLLEVTTGAQQISGLPLPLLLRTAILAAATGFGGAAVIMQNQAVLPEGTLPLLPQIFWQTVHAVLSFLIALGLGLMVL